LFLLKEKATPWEGGIRTAAFVWSKLLSKKKTLPNPLMHISDWLPTLYQAAGKLYLVTCLISAYSLVTTCKEKSLNESYCILNNVHCDRLRCLNI